ncbi:hypothetical protein E2C01_098084 [Portunus trituberculatus]|uniref:Uncharacterized protein n=1 Tax=Portunus trituberculatus TaxID=210409 RepID=A0A5B7K7G1_PORTR|nr:hypothetical protein [Portunus trituberculatus]
MPLHDMEHGDDRWNQGTLVLIYADDILLQCPPPRILQLALSALCVQMQLVINECKTKFQAKGKVSRLPTVNNVPAHRVHIHKYSAYSNFAIRQFCDQGPKIAIF